MKAGESFFYALAFLRRHRIVVLITCVIAVASIFAIIIILGGRDLQPTYGQARRDIQRLSNDSRLPPKPLEKWGPDPFRDVLRELEIAQKKAKIKAEQLAKKEAERKAKEDAEKQALLEAERAIREEAERIKKEESERKEKEEKERQRRKMAILSLNIDGILFSPKGDSTAIIEGKPYKSGDSVPIKDGEALIKNIEQNAILFEDKKSFDTYRVQLSR